MSLWEGNVLPLRSERLPMKLRGFLLGKVLGVCDPSNLWEFVPCCHGVKPVCFCPHSSLARFEAQNQTWTYTGLFGQDSKASSSWSDHLLRWSSPANTLFGSPKWPYLSPLACLQVAVIFVSPDALQFFRAPLQPGGAGARVFPICLGWWILTRVYTRIILLYKRFLTSKSAWDKHARIECHRVLRPLSR